VWICPDPRGHIQAVGTDAAGRKQYRYHDVWRTKRDAAKFDHVLDVAARFPAMRKRVAADLAGSGPGARGLARHRVLAAAVRLLDRGVFRVGGEEYAADDGPTDASYGLATLRRDHVTVRGARMEFRYPAKGGIERAVTLDDAEVAPVVRALLRRPDDHPELLAYREGRVWRDVRSGDVNQYLREVTGCDVTAKDFRTWHATVLAAVTLAGPEARAASSPTARKRAVSATMRAVAEVLGNTPAVARKSYVDPRLLDLYHDGVTVPVAGDVTPTKAEAAVLDLLR
jgi:DNA topoisomerase-1